MAHFSKKIMAFKPNSPNELFDSQCIMDSLPHGIAIFDSRLTLVQSNNVFNKIFAIDETKAITVSELLNRADSRKEFADENAQTITRLNEMFFDTGSSKSFNWAYKFHLTNKKTLELHTEFFPNKGIIMTLKRVDSVHDNQMIEFQVAKDYLEAQTEDAIHMAEDLAIAKEEAANNALRIQTILNAMEEGLVTLNKDGKIVSANNAMSIIFGYTPSDFLGMKLSSLVNTIKIHTAEQITALLNKQVDGNNVYKSDELGQHKDGSIIPLKIDIREVYLEH